MLRKCTKSELKAAEKAIITGEITQKEAANSLGITPRHLRRLLPNTQKPKKPNPRETQKAQTQAERAVLHRLVLQVYRDEITPGHAASLCGKSERTVYRHLARLKALLDPEEPCE